MLIFAHDSQTMQPFWLWCYAIAASLMIFNDIRSRKTSVGRLIVDHAKSPVLCELIIILKVLGAGLIFWLFYE